MAPYCVSRDSGFGVWFLLSVKLWIKVGFPHLVVLSFRLGVGGRFAGGDGGGDLGFGFLVGFPSALAAILVRC